MCIRDRIFNEVDMKTRPEANKGLGVKIFAALTAGAVVASEVAHGFHHHHSPEFYGERFSGDVYKRQGSCCPLGCKVDIILKNTLNMKQISLHVYQSIDGLSLIHISWKNWKRKQPLSCVQRESSKVIPCHTKGCQ